MLRKFRKKVSSDSEPQPTALTDSTPFTTSSRADTRPGTLVVDRRRSSGTKNGRVQASRNPSVFSMSTLFPESTGSNSSASSNTTTGNFRGLRVVYQPDTPAPVDIIFVHGLRGHTWKTWCKNHDINLFWPGLWLPDDVDIGDARIFCFGYNAEYGPGAGRTVTNVTDFAKDLLQAMQFGQDDDGRAYKLGNAPIIFVVHSMGGLIVKKAYLLGQHDKNFSEMIRSVSAIIFLATPHRGSSFAETLNRVLMASLQSPKGFISDLNKSSSTLEEINENFRHVAEKLWIWSFYETMATKVVTQRIMIVDKESAVLGYPNEISASLDADHINICKYSSPDDANYISVRNALRSLVVKAKSLGAQIRNERTTQNSEDVDQLLAIYEKERSDLDLFRSNWTPGTCVWFLEEPEVRDWLNTTSRSRILWYTAPPGTGKSILSAFVVDYMQSQGMEPQYFFFRFDDPRKRSVSACLQQIACQFALSNRAFCRRLQSLSQEGVKLDRADPVLIWQRVFEAIMFQIEFSRPLFWVIDGLDESEKPTAFLDLLQRLPDTQHYLRVLILSRKSQVLSLAFERLSTSAPLASIEHSGRKHAINDISIIFDNEAAYMRGSDAFKQTVKECLLKRAESNLLWVRLVLQEILVCHTEDEVMETLEDIPGDMTRLYERMEAAILTNQRKANIRLAKSLLRWAICSRRPLHLMELSGALPGFLDLRRTISDLCGQFISVDEGGTIGLIHQTAREYLTKTSTSEISINLNDGHDELCLKTISVLMGESLRSDLTHRPEHVRRMMPFVFYASTSWAYHLRRGSGSEEVLNNAIRFLQSLAILTWIHTLALDGRLDVLVKAAKDLIAVAAMLRKENAAKSPLFQRITEVDILERWSVDLMKILAKFGKAMLENPLSIYKTIPAICPKRSIIYEQFHLSNSLEISTLGNDQSTWSDNLVRLFLPDGQKATRITCAGPHLAVLGANGSIYIWTSRDFVSVCVLRHEEPITAMCLNRKGDRLASYGLKTTKLWSVPSGQMLRCASNIPDIKAMVLRYAENDKKILAGMDDNRIRYLTTELSEPEIGWKILCDAPARANSDVESSFFNSPFFMQFNGDETQIGMSYRGFPLTVWSLSESRCIGRSKRSKSFHSNAARPSGNWFGVDRFTFNPVTGHVLGVYRDGCIFKWHPITDENQEVPSTADEIDASADGRLFITSDTDGKIAVWSFSYMSKIYQLSSSDLVQGLSFSPDTQRFYDIRGRSVNAWEPNALIKFVEREVSSSDSASEEQASSFTNTSEAIAAPLEPITAVATCWSNKIFCVGNEEGVIHLHDVQTGQKRKIAEFSNFQCVSHLELSADGRQIVAADLSGDFLIKEISNIGLYDTGLGAINISTLARPKLDLQDRNIHQILFNNDASLLLVVSNSFAQIWSIHLTKVIARSELNECHTRKWLRHPSRDGLIFGFGPYDIKVYRWADLKELSTICYGERINQVSDNKQTGVDERLPYSNRAHLETTGKAQVMRAFLTQDGLHVLVQVETLTAQVSGNTRLLVFDTRHLAQTVDSAKSTASFFEASEHIIDSINVPLGILPGFRLVFLDADLWLCTIDLNPVGQENTMRRRFFVPRDWATTSCFELSCLLRNGIFICPRDADVAIVNYCWEDSCI